MKLNGKNYYVASQYIKKGTTTTTAKTYTKYKTTTKVNYRTGAGTSYSKGGTLASGKTIQVEDGYKKIINILQSVHILHGLKLGILIMRLRLVLFQS